MYQILSGFFKTGMFKITSTPLSNSTSGLANVTQQISRSAKSLIVIFLIFAGLQGKAQNTYYLTTANVGTAQIAANWNTGGVDGGGTAASNFTSAGDIFIISSGQTATFGANVTFGQTTTSQTGTNLTIAAGGVADFGNNILTLSSRGNTNTTILDVSGKIILGTTANQIRHTIASSGKTAVNINSEGTLVTANTSGIVNGVNGTINTNSITTFNAAANYEFNGAAQSTTGLPATVNNLTLSGSGAKTLINTTTSISGNLALSGSATATTVVGLTIGGTLTVGDGTTFTAAGFALTVNGATTVGGGTSGTLTVSSPTGTKLFTGLVTVSAGATWNNSGNSPVSFAGGITNNGTFTAGSGVHTFQTNAQNLTGTLSIPSVTVTTITVTNNNTLTVGTTLIGTGGITNAGTLNLSGATTAASITSLTNSGTLAHSSAGTISTALANFTNTGTINLSGSGTIAGITNNTAGTVNHSGSSTITSFNNATATSTLNISTTPTVPTITTLTTSTSGNTVNYSGAGAQTVKNNTYSNLTLSGSGAKTVTSSVIVSGKLTMAGTATISGSPETSSSILTIDPSTTANIGSSTLSVASLEIGASSTLASSGSLSISGNFTNNGIFNSTGTVTLTGGAQTISGATTFNNLTINGAGVKSVPDDITISGTMTLTSGIINVTAVSKKVIFNAGSSVSVNADKSSFIKGFVQKIGNTDFTFPVGGLVNGVNTYRPIVIAGQGGAASASTSFTAKYYEATNAASLASMPIFKTQTPQLTGVSDFEYWDLTPSLASGITADVTLDYSPSLYPVTASNYSNLRLAHLTGTQWEYFTGDVGPSASDFASRIITKTSVSSFSPFTMGSISAAALPVTLTSFTAKPTPDNKVSLAWVTSSEQVNKGFRIERQTTTETGKFAQIGFVATKAKDGNSQSVLTYNFIDNAPKMGASSFYRLVQEDLDGKLTYSDIRVVRLNGESVSMVFPNPSNGVVNISRTADGKKMNIQVIDQSGKIVSQAYNITNANYTMSILQSGIYSVKLMYPETGEQSIQRIVVQR